MNHEKFKEEMEKLKQVPDLMRMMFGDNPLVLKDADGRVIESMTANECQDFLAEVERDIEIARGMGI